MDSIGAATGDTGFNIGLKCQSGASLYVTLTDLTAPANTSDQLTLAPASTAKGVKLHILRNGSPVGYGPDSRVAGNPNQWYVGRAPDDDQYSTACAIHRDWPGFRRNGQGCRDVPDEPPVVAWAHWLPPAGAHACARIPPRRRTSGEDDEVVRSNRLQNSNSSNFAHHLIGLIFTHSSAIEVNG
ncbi:hypothetical protein [Burkholderia sp. MSMB1826]|uniref:hypothetical protein n=1 Tax=Burkholderia sp. MSMB1826 TaxID=1637875 RepID=UPI0015CF8D57|nr:hypothetical protein [Burkholderia sp. MSMB1826]